MAGGVFAFVLDAQAVSLLADEDRRMTAILGPAQEEDYAAVISIMTIAEQRRDGKAGQRLRSPHIRKLCKAASAGRHTPVQWVRV